MTTATNVGNCSVLNSTTVTCQLFTGEVVNPGDAVSVTLNGVVNPPDTADHNATVSTTSRLKSLG